MDHAKIALQKAEETEARLNALARAGQRENAAGCFSAPWFDLRRADYPLATVTAPDNAGLTVKARLRLDAACAGRLCLKVGGLFAAESAVAGERDAVVETVLLAACYIGGAADLTLAAQKLDCTLLEVSLLLNGRACALNGGAVTLAADTRGETTLLVYAKADKLYGCGLRAGSDALDTPFVIGEGRTGDVAATRSGFAVVYADSLSNLWLIALSDALVPAPPVYAGRAAGAFALFFHDGALLLAELTAAGTVAVCALDPSSGTRRGRGEAVFSKPIRAIRFVKGADAPVLFAGDGERCFYKRTAPETTVDDTVYCGLSVVLRGT
ncbi:MAG: hypothetical protein LBH24_02200 [Clostridiales bacterium]|jgi:hypothetical protein|nr:hypothetical protein [Clostridiales bacterium]